MHKKKIADIYNKQERRLNCKACGKKLTGTNDLTKLGIGYEICNNCSHLNGIFDDSNEYCNEIYAEDGGKDYSKNYDVSKLSEYNSRVNSI